MVRRKREASTAAAEGGAFEDSALLILSTVTVLVLARTSRRFCRSAMV
jgi:hypothetical protein